MPKRMITDRAESFVKRVESHLRASGKVGSLELLACRLLTGKDIKTAAFVWRTLLAYKYGSPKQALEVTGEVQHTLSASDRESANKAIEKLQKLLPPAEQTIEVSGKELN